MANDHNSNKSNNKWNNKSPGTKEWQEKTRLKIQSSKLLERLSAFANDEEINGKKVDMSSQQVKVALNLLSKTLPDLSSSEVTHISENSDPMEILERLRPYLGEEAFNRMSAEYKPEELH